MNNKVLVNIYVVPLDKAYELFISTNETVEKTLELFLKLIEVESDIGFDEYKNYCLVNPDNGTPYANNLIIRDTDIRNSKNLLLISNNS